MVNCFCVCLLQNIESTDKRYLLAVDVSASMQYGEVNGADSITPSVAMSAMALLTVRTERTCDVVGFSNEMTRVPVNKRMNLEEVQHAISEVFNIFVITVHPNVYLEPIIFI